MIFIITVCFNAEKYIGQAINSVLEQEKCVIEYIVYVIALILEGEDVCIFDKI